MEKKQRLAEKFAELYPECKLWAILCSKNVCSVYYKDKSKSHHIDTIEPSYGGSNEGVEGCFHFTTNSQRATALFKNESSEKDIVLYEYAEREEWGKVLA